MNAPTIIISAILVIIVGAIIWKMIKDKKKGKSIGCNCGCSGCPGSSTCHDTKHG